MNELVPQDRPADVVSVEDLRDKSRRIVGGADATRFEAGEGQRTLDPIAAYEREAERMHLAGARTRSEAPDVPMTQWTDMGGATSRADGPLEYPAQRHADLLRDLNQTVRVDKDGAVEYGVVVGAHDLRVKRVFVR